MYYSPKTSTDGLVFHYDTGNTVRSYLGEPTVNLHPNPEDASSWTGNLFNNWIQSAVTSNSVIAPNGTLTGDRLGDGYGRFNASVSVTGGQTYTYSVYLKNVSLTNNFTIVYAWGLNGTLVSYGTLVDVVVSQLSTTQWTRITATITAPGSGVNQVQFGPCPFTGYGNPSGQQIDVWGGMIEQKSHVTPYTTGTRSATQGLKDLTAKNSIDIGSVSFDSNAQMTFDGTDDFIPLGNLGTIGSAYTLECVFNSTSVTSYRNVFDMNYNTYSGVTGNTGPRLEQYTGQGITFIWSGVTDNNNLYNYNALIPISVNRNYHVVFVQDGSTGKLYLDGTLRDSANNAQGYLQTFGDAAIGRGFTLDPSRYFSGGVYVFKIYKKALTADEVQRNFNAVKSRFNIA
jgi:hypothetical protein